ncbi:MAG TPA: FAD-dependent monooxygenase [Myxococcota bacterium]|nr:FAD-dependent monooxygenase [Myxococcota bacterium]
MAWDAICVGGGLGGAGIAFALAKAGARVLVLERETKFRDRVRGEYLECWGVAAARDLGLQSALADARAHRSPWLDNYIGGMRLDRRSFDDATGSVFPAPLCVGHPAFQEAVLAAASAAGAEVRRGVNATEVTPGRPAQVRVRGARGEVSTESARLVVGADGRDSKLRAALGFQETRDPYRLCLAGVLLEGYTGPDDASAAFWNFPVNEQALLFPRDQGVLRGYMAYRSDSGVTRFSGKERIPDFLAAFRAAGVPAEWLAGARAAGPLAGFEGADSRVTHPVREGVALVGDAAACSDPVWGCGMSLTLRDVRTLRDALAASQDWDAALHAYADEHDRYYDRLHTLEDWMTRIFFEPGPEAEALRGRVFAKAAADPGRVVDIVGRGPDQPVDEAARRYFFAED